MSHTAIAETLMDVHPFAAASQSLTHAAPGTSTSSGLLRHMFAIIDAREWHRLGEVFAPDVTYERPGYEPIVGLDALTHFYASVRQIVSGTHHIDSVVVEAGRAAAWGRFVGVLRTGAPADERFADVYTLVGGDDPRVHHRRSYFFRPAI